MAQESSPEWKGRLADYAAYALPNIAIGMLVMPAATIVPSLYVKERGLALAAIGVVLMAASIFDAVADIVIGYLSDVTKTLLPGGRKAWLVMGALVAMPSVYFLFDPPADAGIGYFAIWSIAVYAAWAMLLIPYTAWGAELSRGYHERTRIVTARSIANQLGTLAFLATPMLLAALHVAQNAAIDFRAATYVALALIVLLPLTIAPAILMVPQGIAQIASAPKDIFSALRSLAGNGPMQIYVVSYLVSEIGYGFFATVIFFYIDAYLQSGPSFAYIILVANAATLASFPLWERVTHRIGKKATWGLSWLLQSLSLLALVAVPRGHAGLDAAVIVIGLNSLFSGAGSVVAPSILGDIIDYDTWKTGGYRAGNYFALYSLTIKIVVAVGGGLSLVMLGWFHYNVKTPAANGPAENFGMLFVFAIAPAILRLLALFVLWRYPLDERRQRIIREDLQRREVRAAQRIAAPSLPVPGAPEFFA